MRFAAMVGPKKKVQFDPTKNLNVKKKWCFYFEHFEQEVGPLKELWIYGVINRLNKTIQVFAFAS